MKKYFWGIILLAALLVSLPTKAQFIKSMQLLTPHYYPGIVYFHDGHHEEYAEIELPRTGKSALGVKKSADEKKHTDINAADIVGIKFWHKNFPDKVHVLYYVHARKAMMHSEHQWGNPVMGSAWGVVFECEMNYEMDKKTGDLKFVKFVGGNAPDTPTLYYLLRKEWDLAELVMCDGRFAEMKKKVSKFFEEKPEIAEGIRKGKLKGSDMQYILDEMAGGKKAETPVEAIHQVQTDSVSNGQVGDDE